MTDFISDKHRQLVEDWVAHEAAGAPDDFYAEQILNQLDVYDRMQGLPERHKSKFDELELRKQERQIQYEADVRNGFPLGQYRMI